MIGPDLNRVTFDTGAGETLEFCFDNRAIIRVAEVLKLDIPAMRIGRMGLEMTVPQVPIYFWAALLHARPKLTQVEADAIFDKIAAPIGDLISALGEALAYGQFGSQKIKAAQPPAEAKPNGADPTLIPTGIGAIPSA